MLLRQHPFFCAASIVKEPCITQRILKSVVHFYQNQQQIPKYLNTPGLDLLSKNHVPET
jgi:hypothetical protein